MNYSIAARKAIRAFEILKGRVATTSEGLTIEKSAQFRSLTVLESSGSGNKLHACLFGLEFCSKDGDNYRNVWIRVYSEGGSVLDLSTLQSCQEELT